MALHPIDTPEQRLALARSNRRAIAGRTDWPDDALQACEDFDARHPGWFVTWVRANTTSGWEHPAGYTAMRFDGTGTGTGGSGIFRWNIAALDALFELTS
jgi:hypothetical protein